MRAGHPRLLVAAPSRGSGKSTVSIGLAAAFRARGVAVQPFKKGPDFIDPMWLSAAAGRECRNLDFFMMGPGRIRERFARHGADADLSLVETNHGLHDGPDPEGSDSGAALARLLGAPVLLVVNARALNRGVAPLVRGQAEFDPAVRFAGVVLNRVRGRRHEAKCRDAVERYCGLEVLGVLPDLPELSIAERHLGLVPLAEAPDLESVVGAIGEAVGRHVDLGPVLAAARDAGPLPFEAGPGPGRRPDGAGDPGGARVRVGVARDRAFTFYYPENLEALAGAGAEIVPFSPLADPRLPPVDGLYIGGGFPELFMEPLAANAGMLASVRAAIREGMPAWAECGGLMYLARGIEWGGRRAAMAGALPCSVRMEERPAGHGYVLLEEGAGSPWPREGRRLRGHEFHHSRLEGLEPGAAFAYRVLRGAGASPGHDGLVSGAAVATYTHVHADGAPAWASDFVAAVRVRAAR